MNHRRFVWHLYSAFLLLITAILLVFGFFLTYTLRDFHYQQTSQNLSARARLVEAAIQGSFYQLSAPELNRQIAFLGQSSDTRITLIAPDGRVLADSHENITQMDNHAQRPEVVAAKTSGEGVSVRFSRSLGLTMLYVAKPLLIAQQPVGVIRTAHPLSDVEQNLQRILWSLVLGGLGLAVLLAPICWLLSRRLSRPLEIMTLAAQRYARGDFEGPLPQRGPREILSLSEAMKRMAVDLAKRIESEKEQRGETEAILVSMVEGIVAVDYAERMIRLNRAAAEFFGVDDRSVQGRLIEEVIRPAEIQAFIRRALDLNEPLEEELVVSAPDKRYLHVMATPLLGGSGEKIGSLVVLHDLTRLRQLEAVRRDFVANVSHELKTPITAIHGAVETLLEDAGDATMVNFLRIIMKQSERLGTLVDDLLELSRIEQGQENGYELRRCPLIQVINNAQAACENLLRDQQIHLQLDVETQLVAPINAHLLEQAIINLLTNAIKYSAAGAKVLIRARTQSGKVLLQVEDYGCGIEAQHLPRLFERFYRVDRARSRKLGGTGLGLAIVKHAVQAHRGDIKVQSTPGKGTTFTILLPLEA
jgi:two-component system phosphate regulon sensor histidine kinase PhoR